MARSTEAASVVLNGIQALFQLGSQTEVSDEDVIRALETVGISGFSEDQAWFLATTGIVLRLMLRHSDVDPYAMFDATRTDLGILGRDIDDQAFDGIARDLEP